ncbi:sce7725 family protein [Clostridium estertheticum]|uniref:sce7725 family protein n=1 Tax=Clostridium estertheticum TaxID=238834 RepID=UPI001C0AF6DE|nr:sce7725 family protein [Clostridium estertheticum]MBU3175175.1 sce7725 family protein [Clostridium estertheticum]
MYFPYLRGRQNELIALRELVDNSLLSDKVIPIIEPVKTSSTLIKTIEIFQGANKKLALVRNPQVGNFALDLKKEENVPFKEKLYKLLELDDIIDVHFLNSNSEKFIKKLPQRGKCISDIITICENEDYIPVFEELFSSENPKYNLMLAEGIFKKHIKNNRVMMKDKFKKKTRNTDYEDIDDESFSTDHLYCDGDGYVGFSDYSIIGNSYIESGFAPRAVAIHIVYFDENHKLRIRHFVSDSNDNIFDPAGKFAEALQKLVEWNKIQKLNTLGINTLTQMYENETYPGLGIVKKLSLMHHIELMGRFLDGDI